MQICTKCATCINLPLTPRLQQLVEQPRRCWLFGHGPFRACPSKKGWLSGLAGDRGDNRLQTVRIQDLFTRKSQILQNGYIGVFVTMSLMFANSTVSWMTCNSPLVHAMFRRCIQRCLQEPSISSMCMTALLELRDLLCAGG